MNPKITVIIPCFNEENYIENCLQSVVNNDYPKEDTEIIIVDGNSNDTTVQIIEKFQKENSNIILLHNPDKIVPVSMNMAIEKATGAIIIRLDAHSSFPNNYFSKLIDWHSKLDAQNVGAVCITEVKNKNKKSNSIKTVLSNKFGVGNSYFRTGIDAVREVDTVPFGCFKKEVFTNVGNYNIKLERNQDIELNKRIKNAGGKIFLVPDLQCTYFARENFTDLFKNNYANGLWNLLTVYITKTYSSLSLRHFIPMFFLLSLIIPFLLSLVYKPFIFLSLISFISYSLLIFFISFKENTKETSLLYLISSFYTLHISYGLGSVVGLLKIISLSFTKQK